MIQLDPLLKSHRLQSPRQLWLLSQITHFMMLGGPHPSSVVTVRIGFLAVAGLGPLAPRSYLPLFYITCLSSQHASLLIQSQEKIPMLQISLPSERAQFLRAHLIRSGLFRIISRLIND